jgi:ADP-ribosylglycohydrolase
MEQSLYTRSLDDPVELLGTVAAVLEAAEAEPILSLLLAANLGRASARRAAVVGAITGAHGGTRVFPSAWLLAVRAQQGEQDWTAVAAELMARGQPAAP